MQLDRSEMEKTSQPMVSVVVPVYNTAESLMKKCLFSVLEQDYEKLELVIVDDGSNEEVAFFVDSLSARGAKVIHKENGGLSDARNCGVESSEGDYIYFLDSDDELASSDSIAALVKCAVANKTDVVVGGFHFVDCPDFDVSCANGRDWLVRCLEDGRVSFSAADQLYSRSLLSRLGSQLFVRNLVHEDEEFTPRALMSAEKVVGMADVQTYVRNEVEGSITTSESAFSIYKRCEGKLRVAILSMGETLFSDDSPLRSLMDERAYGFVAMALRSCARDLWGTTYFSEIVSLARMVDYSRARITLRSPRVFRNWVCMRLIKHVGPERFMALLKMVDRR